MKTHVIELNYQMSALTTELRNIRDTMSALNNSMQENSNFLEAIIYSSDHLRTQLQRSALKNEGRDTLQFLSTFVVPYYSTPDVM